MDKQQRSKLNIGSKHNKVDLVEPGSVALGELIRWTHYPIIENWTLIIILSQRIEEVYVSALMNTAVVSTTHQVTTQFSVWVDK